MKNGKNTYKSIIKDAKNRLTTNDYGAQNFCSYAKPALRNAQTVSGAELNNYYSVISELQKTNVLNAIGTLIDESFYESLSPDAKEYYVLSVGNFYREIKENLNKRKKMF